MILGSSIVKDKKIRGTLIAFRTVALVVFFLILADPVRKIPKGDLKSRTENYFLVDTSQSMGVEYPSRLEQGLDLISPAMTNTTLKKHSHLYNFDIDLNTKEHKLEDYLSLKPGGSQTRLGKSLGDAVRLFKDKKVANIILCTDGRHMDEHILGQAILDAKSENIPISVIPAGSEVPQFNLSIVECRAPRSLTPKEVAEIKVTVKGTSTTKQKTYLVIRAPGGKDKDGRTIPGKEVARKEVIASNDKQYISLSFDPENVSGIYTVELVPYKVIDKKTGKLVEGELTYKDNLCKFKLKIDDPKIKVLYMEGTIEKYKDSPDAKEKRFAWSIFERALMKGQKIEVDTYFVDKQRARGGKLISKKTKQVGLPKTKEELFKYDVIICSDINKKAMLDANPKFLDWVCELVEKRGGGFVMIGGRTAFGSGFWQETVWEEMIPMQMKLKKYMGQGKSWNHFQPKFAPDAFKHPIMKLSADPKKNKEIFKLHPRFTGTNVIMRAKPGATVLMTHARLGLDGRWVQSRYWDRKNRRWVEKKGKKEYMPILAVQEYGRGRSMAFTPDAAGGWGKFYMQMWGPGKKNNKYYAQFWQNAVNWLAANSIAKRGSVITGETEILTYKPGETMKIRANVFSGKDGEELKNSVQVYAYLKLKGHEDKSAEDKVKLSYDAKNQNFAGRLAIPADFRGEEASVIFEAIDTKANKGQGKEIGKDFVPIRILQLGDELREPMPDFKSMQKLVQETGGEWITTKKQLRKFISDTAKRKQAKAEYYRVPLWDKKWVFALILIVLTIEWVIRKRIVMG